MNSPGDFLIFAVELSHKFAGGWMDGWMDG